jgi:hypothetical protein
MIEKLTWASRHATRLPYAVAIIACFDPDCECATIPIERKLLAAHFRFTFDGTLPPLVKSGDRYLGLLELEDYLETLSTEKRLSLLKQVPSEYQESWRGCKLPGCHNWFEEKAAMQRHVQIMHPGKKLVDVFDRPFICGFRLERSIGPLGVKEGSYRHCYEAFNTKKELVSHKTSLKHFRPGKKKGAQKAARAAPKPAAPAPAAQLPPPAEKSDSDSEISDEEDEEENFEDDEEDGEDEMMESSDGEESVEVDAPVELLAEDRRPRSKRPPSSTLRDTFVALLKEIKSSVDSGRATTDSGVRSIVNFVAGKAFVRSDFEEENARKVARSIKAEANVEKKMQLFVQLYERLINLDFSSKDTFYLRYGADREKFK